MRRASLGAARRRSRSCWPRLRRGAPNVQGTLRVDPDVPLGADPAGRLRLYAPDPVDPGSSISHWDLPATSRPLDGALHRARRSDRRDGSHRRAAPRHRLDDRQLQRRGALSTTLPGEGFNCRRGAWARSAAPRSSASPRSGAACSGARCRSTSTVSFETCPARTAARRWPRPGPRFIFESFSGADILHAWYPGALAESLVGPEPEPRGRRRSRSRRHPRHVQHRDRQRVSRRRRHLRLFVRRHHPARPAELRQRRAARARPWPRLRQPGQREHRRQSARRCPTSSASSRATPRAACSGTR